MAHYLLGSEEGAVDGHDLQALFCAFAAACSGQAVFHLVVSSLLPHAALHPLEEMTLEITAGTFQFSPKGFKNEMCPLLAFYSQSVHNFCTAILSQRRERRVARRYVEMIKKQIWKWQH